MLHGEFIMKLEKHDIVIIGGGQAGLSIALQLQKKYDYLILEKHKRVGDSWRQRYDSLVLFTSRHFSQLEGMQMPGDESEYPTRDEMAEYLEAYSKNFELKIETGESVTKLSKEKTHFKIEKGDEKLIIAKVVIIATGGFEEPITLESDSLAISVPQFTVNTYKNSNSLPEGRVLVVGDGATGRQIALDVSKTHPVTLSTGKKRNIVPQRVLGRDIFFWLDKLGILGASVKSLLGRILKRRDPFPGKHLELKTLSRKGIKVTGRLKSIQKQNAQYDNGFGEEIKSVIWAVGFKSNTSWVKIEEALMQSQFLHDKGVSPVGGLFYIGQPWQRNRGSALITGLKHDNQFILKKIEAYLNNI